MSGAQRPQCIDALKSKAIIQNDMGEQQQDDKAYTAWLVVIIVFLGAWICLIVAHDSWGIIFGPIFAVLAAMFGAMILAILI
jgi:hypothetical protein